MCFIAFLGDPLAKHLEGLYKAFIFYPTPIPLGLWLIMVGEMMESGKYGKEWYDGSLREFPVGNLSPRKTTY
jgi:hypothetical protein